MVKAKSIQEITATESDLDYTKMICSSLSISASPALTALRAAHKALNNNDFCKGLELYVDRIQNKTKRPSDCLIAENALARRFSTINDLADESCILSGFAANNLLYHCLCLLEKGKRFAPDVGGILKAQLQNEFDAGKDDIALITPCEINEVIEKFDCLYPGFSKLIEKRKTIFAIIDAFKKTEDGLLANIILDPDSISPIPRTYIFLLRPNDNNKSKAVLVHELCHLLLETVANYPKLNADLEEMLGHSWDLERAAMNGLKEEVICQIMTCGVLHNEIFSSDDYQDGHAIHLAEVLGEKGVSVINEIANMLFTLVVRKETEA